MDSLKTFNLENIQHNVRRNLTQVDPRLPKEIRNIQLLLAEEKNVLASMQNFSEEKREASKLLRIWGKENGDDFEDITDKLADLLSKVSDIEQVMTEKYGHYRNLLKEIRTAEEALIPSRERKRKIHEEIQRIQKSHPKSPRIPELEADLAHVNKESASSEAEAGNTIRKKLKEALKLYLESLFENSEKIAIISGFGWDIVDQIDDTPYKLNSDRPEYEGKETTYQIIKECQVALLRWQPSSTDIRPLLPALTNTAPAALAAQKQEYEEKLSQLTASMNSLREEHESQVKGFATNLEEQRKAFETQVNDLAAALESQKEGYEAQLNDLSAALSEEKKASVQKINEANAALTGQKERYDAQIAELNAIIETQRKQYEEQLKQYNTLITTKQEYEVALKERDSIVSKLQNDISSVATERGKLSQLVKDLEETLKSKSTLEKKEDKVGKLEDEISSIKNQLAGLKFTSSVNTTQLSDPGHRSISSAAGDTSTIPTTATARIQHVSTVQQPPYGYQQPPPPQQPVYTQPQQPQQPQGNFVGGFWNPDDAPPAYDGPKEGYNDDKKTSPTSPIPPVAPYNLKDDELA
ncbi:3126_t:CDS:2 [Acaulospora colombiana]|uniref:3126_t:CDS:1 n=1 Tax=Acaulospora colombiana TaxID=27376 RepID=A0ACA9KIW6_9GLOM|nr:3126_t:CDS:2 [Acaulospora colombiana]